MAPERSGAASAAVSTGGARAGEGAPGSRATGATAAVSVRLRGSRNWHRSRGGGGTDAATWLSRADATGGSRAGAASAGQRQAELLPLRARRGSARFGRNRKCGNDARLRFRRLPNVDQLLLAGENFRASRQSLWTFGSNCSAGYHYSGRCCLAWCRRDRWGRRESYPPNTAR